MSVTLMQRGFPITVERDLGIEITLCQPQLLRAYSLVPDQEQTNKTPTCVKI